MTTTIVTEPLTYAQVKSLADADDWIAVDIYVSLEEIIDNDLEGFLDIICSRTGIYSLMDFIYGVSGVSEDGQILIHVEGDASEFLEDENPDESDEIDSED